MDSICPERATRLKPLWRSFVAYLFHTSPQRLLVTVFSLAIFAGTLLLLLPWAHAPGKVGPLDAFFTATSAVCVTGLIVVDTATDYTVFGQGVILALIQIGGLGIMTFAAIAFELGGARMPLAQQAALEDSFFQRDVAVEFSQMFRRILKLVFIIEGIGVILLFFALSLDKPSAHAAWSSVFHTVSAFCNAGFSIYTDSLIGLRGNAVAMTAVMILIVLGGLGHVVLLELYRDGRRIWRGLPKQKPHRFSLHSRVVLTTTGALIIGGMLFLMIVGTDGGGDRSGFFSGALFQSITARTAGFNTVDIAALPLSSLMFIVILMVIGGSPGSCAGGIKTTTFAIWLARIRTALHGQEDVTLMERMIPRELVLRAVALIGLTILWNGAGVVLLSALQPAGTPLKDIVFEQVSAFGTVGLSTGLTAKLTTASRLWIIATMFVGRLGPLTMVFSFLTTSRPRVGCPEGRMMIG
jgi:trk system potassium uptake protein TrkH